MNIRVLRYLFWVYVIESIWYMVESTWYIHIRILQNMASG